MKRGMITNIGKRPIRVRAEAKLGKSLEEFLADDPNQKTDDVMMPKERLKFCDIKILPYRHEHKKFTIVFYRLASGKFKDKWIHDVVGTRDGDWSLKVDLPVSVRIFRPHLTHPCRDPRKRV